MPASYNAHNGLVDIIFRWNDRPVAVTQEMVGSAALYVYLHIPRFAPTIEIEGEQVPKPWDDLTNQEKLDMVFAATEWDIVQKAKTAYSNAAQNAARDAAREYADEEYSLERE